MTAATVKTSRTTPAALATRYSARTPQRQRDELDPARDDDLGMGAAAPASGGGSRRAGRGPPIPRPLWIARRSSPPSARVCDVPAAPDHPVRRRPRRRPRPARRCWACCPSCASATRRLRRRQRRERRRRPGDHAEDRRRAVRRRRRRDHARQPHLPPPGDLALPRLRQADRPARELPGVPAGPRVHASSRRTACASASSTSAATSTCAPGASRSSEIDDVLASSRARPTTSSSTCTPRRPARRSRWAGTWTGA